MRWATSYALGHALAKQNKAIHCAASHDSGWAGTEMASTELKCIHNIYMLAICCWIQRVYYYYCRCSRISYRSISSRYMNRNSLPRKSRGAKWRRSVASTNSSTFNTGLRGKRRLESGETADQAAPLLLAKGGRLANVLQLCACWHCGRCTPIAYCYVLGCDASMYVCIIILLLFIYLLTNNNYYY